MRTVARRHPHVAALAAYVALAAAATWPLLAGSGKAIAGRGSAPWRTLWGFWWWGDSLGRGVSPFVCDALRWPRGVTGWLEGWDLPATIAMLPVWRLAPGIPEVALYDALVFSSYALSGFTAYLLGRELWGGNLAPFLSGVLYAMGAYHLGQGPGDPLVLEMPWAPLYFLGLVRTVRRHGVGAPLTAGLALGLAALSSPYQLVCCCLGSAVLLVAWLRTDRATLASTAFLHRAALLVATFLVLAGWFYVGMLRAQVAAPHVRAERAASRSADLLAFFVPGATSAWRGDLGAGARAGGGLESAAYIGWIALALAIGAFVRAKAARPWIVLALVGLVLALGPRLHVGGHALSAVLLPFGWAERLAPTLFLDAAPARFAWLVRFGVAMAAGGVLSLLARGGRRGSLVAAAVVVLAVVESWPRPMPLASWPAPRFLRDLARDGERWTVLDVTGPTRRLWNQVLHHHSQIGGGEPGTPGWSDPLPGGLPSPQQLLAVGGSPRARLAAIRALQELNVRFVLADGGALAGVRALRLSRAYEGEGLVIFEVPPRIQMAATSAPR